MECPIPADKIKKERFQPAETSADKVHPEHSLPFPRFRPEQKQNEAIMKLKNRILFPGYSAFHPCLSIEDFTRIAETAREAGFTHVDLGCAMTGRSRYQLDNDGNWCEGYDFYPEYTAVFPAFFKFHVPEKFRAYLPQSYAAANLERFRAFAEILRKLGLKGSLICSEALFLPEKAFADHPQWRGPRCDFGARSRKGYFTLLGKTLSRSERTRILPHHPLGRTGESLPLRPEKRIPGRFDDFPYRTAELDLYRNPSIQKRSRKGFHLSPPGAAGQAAFPGESGHCFGRTRKGSRRRSGMASVFNRGSSGALPEGEYLSGTLPAF